jgi:pimeloyl-ACP methyl ester carboxylesterase
MRLSAKTAGRGVAVAMALSAISGCASAQVTAPTVAPSSYARPHQLVAIADGRRINLDCAGEGSPTVILTAGLGGWSGSWIRVQPEIAKVTRVCAWDRAGFGYSDPSPEPQDAAHTTADLEHVLAAAKIAGPYILVSHSAGSYETLMVADRHLQDVAAIVLVDPSVPDQTARFNAVSPVVGAFTATSTAKAVATYAKCATALASGALQAGGPDPDKCLAQSPAYAADVQAALARADLDPKRQLTKQSLQREFDASSRQVVNAARNFGDIPLFVLTASHLGDPSAPKEVVDAMPVLYADWIKAHDELAALSRHGVNQIVRGAGHSIQIEKPDAVIAAIDAAIVRSRQ